MPLLWEVCEKLVKPSLGRRTWENTARISWWVPPLSQSRVDLRATHGWKRFHLFALLWFFCFVLKNGLIGLLQFRFSALIPDLFWVGARSVLGACLLHFQASHNFHLFSLDLWLWRSCSAPGISPSLLRGCGVLSASEICLTLLLRANLSVSSWVVPGNSSRSWTENSSLSLSVIHPFSGRVS